MDWGFLDIFKKADFNVLMVAAAITAWFLYYTVDSENVWFYAAALLCTFYCAFKLAIHIYKFLSGYYKYNKQMDKLEEQQVKYEEQQKFQNEVRLKESIDEAMRIYVGLSDDNKEKLENIYVHGKPDPLKKYCRLISRADHMLILDAQMVADSFLNVLPFTFGTQKIWFELIEQPDSVLAVFDLQLHDIIGRNLKTKI